MDVSSIGGGAYSYSAQLASQAAHQAAMQARFAEMDLDGDGALNLEESGLDEEQFTLRDADGDGFLTEADRQAMGPPPGPPPGMGDLGGLSTAQLLEALDADTDGALNQEESGLDQEIFSSLDSDEDGLLSAEELATLDQGAGGVPPAGMGPPPGMAGLEASQLITELDTDEDGSVSQSESGLSDETFDKLDTNQDGLVSQAELEAASSSRAQSMLSMGLLGIGGGLGSNYALSSYQNQNNLLAASTAAGYTVGSTGLDMTA